MGKFSTTSKASWGKDLFILLTLSFILYFALIWFRPLASPDEGRYTQIPLEMIRSADYITPTLNDMVYFYKPPLFYWMQAAAINVFGENLFAFRFANSAVALLGIVFAYCIARALYGRSAGIFSAIILATTSYYFGLGQVITLDMTVSVFIAGTMFSFIVAIKRSGILRGLLILSFFLSSALAVMSKGLIGILIPIATIFLYALAIGIPSFTKKFRLSDLWWSLVGIMIFSAVALPWHILAAIENPSFDNAAGLFSKDPQGQGFLWYYIVHEHILRFVDVETSKRAEPIWYFFALAPIGFIPYIVLLPSMVKDAFAVGWKKLRDEDSETIFFAIWIVFVILFFSASSSKLPAYILPIYPALAVWGGKWFSEIWDSENFERIRFSKKIFIALGYIATIAPIIAYFVLERKGKLLEDAPEMLAVSLCLSILMASSTSVALYFSLKKNDRVFWKFVLVATCLLLIMFNPMTKYLQRESTRGLVEQISDVRKPEDIFVIAYDYNPFQDFPVWLGQTVYTIGRVPDEQMFGYMRAREKNESRFIETEAELKNLISSTKGEIYVAIIDGHLEYFRKNMNVKFSEVARSRNLLLLKLEK